METKRIVILDDDDFRVMISELMETRSHCIITGEPGTGKSYWADFLKDHYNPKEIIQLDDYGRVKDGQWIVDPPELPRARSFYIGTCSNFDDFVRWMVRQYGRRAMAMVVLETPADFWRHTQSLKASKKSYFQEAFKKRATRTDAQIYSAFDKYWGGCLKHNLAEYLRVFIVRPGTPTRGWHESDH